MPRRMWLPVLPVLLVLGLAATPVANAESSSASTSARATATMTTEQFEYQLLYKTNVTRSNNGCVRLRVNSILVQTARTHSAYMAKYGTLSHKFSTESSLGYRVTRAGYIWKALAENIAYGSPDPSLIYGSWMRSPAHKANIVNCKFRDIGIGVKYAGGHAWVTMDLGLR